VTPIGVLIYVESVQERGAKMLNFVIGYGIGFIMGMVIMCIFFVGKQADRRWQISEGKLRKL
jgi:hypothetical protein